MAVQTKATTSWRNWAGTESAVATEVVRPTDLDELSTAVAGAEKSVRARGSGHSFTAVGAAHDRAIDLSAWTGIVSADLDADLVTVRSGTTLRALNAELDHLGRAMTNLGDIDAQTIAGAISTGTHGTGAGYGGISTQVAALELVLADGKVVTCSPTERPELFAAARVGLGAFGVISTITLRTEPSFVLHAEERPEPIEDVLAAIDDNCAGNDHFEFYWFPYGRNALTKRNNRLPAGSAPEPLSRTRQFVEYQLMENLAFGAVCRMGRAVRPLVRPLNRLSSAVLSARAYSDVSHRVFVTNRNVRFVESEYAVPRESLPDVLKELREGVARLADPVIFPVEIRVAAADDIWLSTAHERDSAYVAIHQFVGMPYQEYFTLFESIAGSVGGRPHWGKMHSLDANALRERYPRFDDFTALRAELDPQGKFLNPYLKRVLGA
jgi:L-gulono-1,4-lactone dehydrogenase